MSAIGHDHLNPVGDALFEQALRYICVSSTVILVYDTILTLDLEVTHVWRSKWNLMKVLYLLTRYSTFIDIPVLLIFYLSPNLSMEQCSRLHMIQQWLFGLGVGSAQAVLVIRTMAFYDHDKHVRLYMYFFLFLVYTPVTLILVFWSNVAKFGPPPPGIHGCHIKEKRYILFTAYIALALTETVLVVLTLRQVLKKFGSWAITPEDEERTEADSRSLIRTLNQDGVLFFICLFVLSIANMMISFHGPYTDLLSPLQRVLHGTLTSRMVLHLREAATYPPEHHSSLVPGGVLGRASMYTTGNTRSNARESSIRFASPTQGEGGEEMLDMGCDRKIILAPRDSSLDLSLSNSHR